MDSHTKEPWLEYSPALGAQSVTMDVIDYRRARACVNACAGIPTESLESVAHAVSERDRLAAALKRMTTQMRNVALVCDIPERFAKSFNEGQAQSIALLAEVEASAGRLPKVIDEAEKCQCLTLGPDYCLVHAA